jgi:hypothetical protein
MDLTAFQDHGFRADRERRNRSRWQQEDVDLFECGAGIMNEELPETLRANVVSAGDVSAALQKLENERVELVTSFSQEITVIVGRLG